MDKISVSVDAVIFGYDSDGLSIILIQRKNEPYQGQWALPGGFVEEDEPLEDAAKRELQEETGVRVSSLYQVYTFGAPDRDPRSRVISVAHMGLVKKELHTPKGADDAKRAEWISLHKLPPLAFDHAEIIEKSVKKLHELLEEKITAITADFSEAEIEKIKKILQ